MRISIPIRLVSLANLSKHWRVRHGYTKAAKEATRAAILADRKRFASMKGATGYTIAFVCHGTRIRDRDNLTSALKPIRDEICVWLGVEDSERYGIVEFPPPEWGRSGGAPSVDVEILRKRQEEA